MTRPAHCRAGVPSSSEVRCIAMWRNLSRLQQVGRDHLSRPTPNQVIIASICITILVTFYSLSELQGLLASHHGQSAGLLPGQEGGLANTVVAAGTSGTMRRSSCLHVAYIGCACEVVSVSLVTQTHLAAPTAHRQSSTKSEPKVLLHVSQYLQVFRMQQQQQGNQQLPLSRSRSVLIQPTQLLLKSTRSPQPSATRWSFQSEHPSPHAHILPLSCRQARFLSRSLLDRLVVLQLGL